MPREKIRASNFEQIDAVVDSGSGESSPLVASASGEAPLHREV